MQQKSVLIVGGGPVGVALGCQLKRYGISCRLIEKRLEPTQHSKAININAASLQMLHKMNMTKRFLDQGKKVQDIYLHWEKKRIAHVDYGKLFSPYPFFLSLPQSTSEQILGEYLEDFGQSLERGVELIDLSVDLEGVNVVLQTQKGIEKARFDYLVACDGSKSTVRNRLSIPFKGVDLQKHFLLFDGLIDWSGRFNAVHYFISDKGFFILAPMAEGYYRMVLSDSQNGMHSYSFSEMQKLIAKFGPADLRLKKVLWESKGFFQNRLIENYRYQKRVFFCGDSAHVFSPLGGLGMNTGLQDIDNLAWKLAGVIHRNWPDLLLDTYSAERKAIAEQLITSTDTSTRLINRIEKELTPNIIHWLPSLHNKSLIRKRPYQFSGLAQQYPSSEFLPLSNSLVGAFFPYAESLQTNEGTINTFQLCRSIPSVITFGSCSSRLIALLKSYDFPVYSFSGSNTLKIVCQAAEEDFLLLRPDGVVGFYGTQSSLQPFETYLERWYAPTTC